MTKYSPLLHHSRFGRVLMKKQCLLSELSLKLTVCLPPWQEGFIFLAKHSKLDFCIGSGHILHCINFSTPSKFNFDQSIIVCSRFMCKLYGGNLSIYYYRSLREAQKTKERAFRPSQKLLEKVILWKVALQSGYVSGLTCLETILKYLLLSLKCK